MFHKRLPYKIYREMSPNSENVNIIQCIMILVVMGEVVDWFKTILRELKFQHQLVRANTLVLHKAPSTCNVYLREQHEVYPNFDSFNGNMLDCQVSYKGHCLVSNE